MHKNPTITLLPEVRHPCFDEAMHFRVGRIHLPVAPKCNIHCNFCERKIGGHLHEFRPGVAEMVITPDNVIEYFRDALREFPECEVAGIAGPGEPLFNEATFRTLRIIREKYPEMKLCICTNGLLLPDKVNELKEIGVEFLTVTINADKPEIASRIYTHIHYKERTHHGLNGIKTLVENQFEGVKLAVKAGMMVKVNTVYIPGINESSIPRIAKRVSHIGAHLMNIMPLIPGGAFAARRPPTKDEIHEMRAVCKRYIPQFCSCKQCRADSCGIPGTKEKFKDKSLSSV